MAGNITLTMIKPDAVSKGYEGKILDHFIDKGFRIKAMKKLKLSGEKARNFYTVHSERPFFEDLIRFMTEGPVVAAVLEKDNAVENFREIIGATNPEDAAEGTIRKLYAENIERNAVHGSDSDENAKREVYFFFSEMEFV